MVAHVWPTDHPESQPKQASGPPAAGYAAGLTAWFLVAGVFVAAKFGVGEMPPWTMCFWRLTIATLILLPLAWGERDAVRAFMRGRGWQALLIGAIGLGITQGLVYTALSFTTAINTGIIFSTAPIVTMVLAAVFLREAMGPWQIVGSLIAFAGIVLIAVQGSLAILLGLKLGIGDLLVVVAAVTFAAYTILLKWAKFDLPRLPLLLVLLAGASMVTFPGWLVEIWLGQHSHLAFKGYIALAYAAVPGGALMYLFYNWSIDILGASKAGALNYTQMVFTAVLAWLILGESIAWYHVVGAAFIVVGVAIIELRKAERAAKAAEGKQGG